MPEPRDRAHLGGNPVPVVKVPLEVYIAATKYAATFHSPNGEWVLDDLKNSFSDRTSFVPGSDRETAFKEGERSVILRIERLLKLSRQSPEDAVENTSSEGAD